jgi:hypothetical protein
METAMHGSFDESGKNDGYIQRIQSVVLFALPFVAVVALIGLAMAGRGPSNWISDAVQAEFVGTNLTPDAAPVEPAQPSREVRTVKAN